VSEGGGGAASCINGMVTGASYMKEED